MFAYYKDQHVEQLWILGKKLLLINYHFIAFWSFKAAFDSSISISFLAQLSRSIDIV